MMFHDLGVPKTHPKSISKSMPTTEREAFGLQVTATWLPELPRWLQDDPESVQDAPCMPPGPPQHLPRHLPDRSQHTQGTRKALQEPPRRLREPPRRLQELSRGKLSKPPALGLQSLASGLQVASAGCAKRGQLVGKLRF